MTDESAATLVAKYPGPVAEAINLLRRHGSVSLVQLHLVNDDGTSSAVTISRAMGGGIRIQSEELKKPPNP